MSAPEFTPGPWDAEEGAARGAWIKGSTGEWSALACGDSDASAVANAHLIAAAPELYDVGDEAANLFRKYEQMHLEKGTADGFQKAQRNREIAEKIEAILCKARGQS